MLAEGVMRAAQERGGEASKFAIHTQKGNTPRGHDHRARWSEMFHSLCAEPHRFHYVDAAQLLKHYLGIRHSLADEDVPKALVYLFWEPRNWPQVPAYSQHRSEVLEFSMAVAGGAVEFTAMSYAELWDAWEAEGMWAGSENRLEYLRKRYAFDV
jgi:hypothetical protein